MSPAPTGGAKFDQGKPDLSFLTEFPQITMWAEQAKLALPADTETFNLAQRKRGAIAHILVGEYREALSFLGEIAASYECQQGERDVGFHFRLLEIVCHVCTAGGKKGYARGSWKTVQGWETRYLAAALRHLTRLGDRDGETGLLHVWHAIWNLCAMLQLQAESAKVTQVVPVYRVPVRAQIVDLMKKFLADQKVATGAERKNPNELHVGWMKYDQLQLEEATYNRAQITPFSELKGDETLLGLRVVKSETPDDLRVY